MKLKDYQELALTEVKNFLEQLAIWQERVDEIRAGDRFLRRRHGRNRL